MAGKTNISGSSSNKRTAVAATGTTLLPLTRVKRIIKEEPEVLGCGPESTFLIGLASVNIFLLHVFFNIRHSIKRSIYLK